MDRYLIICPVFDEWEALSFLIPRLESELAKAKYQADVLVVDDASRRPWDEFPPIMNLTAIQNIDVLRLRRNLGHQGAIAVGLCHAAANAKHEAVIVMDGDGEDLPEDAIRLINEFRTQTRPAVIFARRTRRSEGSFFKFSYIVYRLIFRLLTGVSIREGNFSLIPNKLVPAVASISDIWSHYSAGIIKSRIPCSGIDTARGRRLTSCSKMNLVGLINHGLSAVSVYSEVIGTRALLSIMLLGLVCLLLTAVVVAIRLSMEVVVPGWATYVTGILGIILIQLASMAVFFVILMLNTRNKLLWLTIPDYRKLILSIDNVFPGHGHLTSFYTLDPIQFDGDPQEPRLHERRGNG